MPQELLTEAAGLAVAFGWVAAAAAPLAAAGWLATRTVGSPVLPRWGHRPGVWTGWDILFLFILSTALMSAAVSALGSSEYFRSVYGPDFPEPLPPADAVGAVGGTAGGQAVAGVARGPDTLRGLWAVVFATPCLLAVAWVLHRFVHRRPTDLSLADLPGRVVFGVLAWAVVTPVVFAVHFAATYLVTESGGATQHHPLTLLGPGESGFDQAFLGFVVVVVTPLTEEFLFRGLLVRWASGRWYRAWALLGGGALFTLLRSDGAGFAPLGFVAVLGVGLYAVQRVGSKRRRFPVRTASGVYGSAALFAAAHAAVWPSPVPLFVLALGLGYVAARSGGIAACVVMHGLFNAVSLVYLIRGGGV